MPPLAVRTEVLRQPPGEPFGPRSRIAMGYKLERLSVIEQSYVGGQLGVDFPEVIFPLGWGEWDAINPGEALPFGAHVVGA